MNRSLALFTALAAVVLPALHTARAWDYEGHRVVNQLALAALPKDFPAFVQNAGSDANASRFWPANRTAGATGR